MRYWLLDRQGTKLGVKRNDPCTLSLKKHGGRPLTPAESLRYLKRHGKNVRLEKAEGAREPANLKLGRGCLGEIRVMGSG